eukprot:gnl/Ergobibamus_cyprinoides/167.p2 GENE.gnl/Ergobibamus_cyprinoides/167~~gnl/Ergobibamus_cyprinoides/167.p2  ORF type:complete len:435 (-),score=135.11 gnl/Ergobibamus_cyprinoides/167:23-1327(-)
MVPHCTDEIKRRIKLAATGADVAIIELGGTVGDIESAVFCEAIRQFRFDAGKANVLYVHVTLVPYMAAAGELKSKPTQHSVQKLREIGIQPDVLVCRSERDIDDGLKAKIAMFCNVDKEHVISAVDVDSIYKIPALYHAQGLDSIVTRELGIWTRTPRMAPWIDLVGRIEASACGPVVRIGIVAKYATEDFTESYKSVNEALAHAGYATGVKVLRDYVDPSLLVDENDRALPPEALTATLGGLHAILVPGGFGKRGTEAKMAAIRFARERNVPFFGICLGLQLTVTEFARNVCGLTGANSTEFDETTPHPVVAFLPGQEALKDQVGGTMRLGAYECDVVPGTLAARLYGRARVSERHRHRYEVNVAYEQRLTDGGLVVSGRHPESQLVEMVELPDHRFFIALQAHPEFLSKPIAPHPVFQGFVDAAAALQREQQ